MKVEVTQLTHPKSEHTSETNQDAAGHRADLGLFVVCDGVGTTSFAREWAQILVQHTLREPLMGNDPFEVEWWLRSAQNAYEQTTPDTSQLKSHYLAKALEGAQSTLLLCQVSSVKADSAEAKFLAFGDSCAILRRRENDRLWWFPLKTCADFDHSPVCLPARPEKFDRDFHTGAITNLTLRVHDRLVLATDAVARWIVSGPGEIENHERFDQLTGMAPEDWEQAVDRLRRTGDMGDDDATATVIHFAGEGAGETLGATAELPTQVIEQRTADLRQAQKDNRADLLARFWGDGRWFKGDRRTTEHQAKKARITSQALKAVVGGLRKAIQKDDQPDSVRRNIQPVWDKYAHLLRGEPSAAGLRTTLSCVFGVELYRSPELYSEEEVDSIHEQIRRLESSAE